MRCPVCNQQTEAMQCPRCGYFDVLIPGETAQACALQTRRIEEHWETVLENLQIEFPIYHLKEEAGRWVKREERLYLCRGSDLLRGKILLNKEFARSEQTRLKIKVCLSLKEKPLPIKELELTNLPEARLQQLGIEMDEQHRICLILTNGIKSSKSDHTSLF